MLSSALHNVCCTSTLLFIYVFFCSIFTSFTGWDLVYDNGFIEIDPAQCGYTTFLGAGVPEPEAAEEEDENED